MNELPSGWVEASLSDVALIIAGQAPPGTSYNSGGEGLPLFQGKTDFGEIYLREPHLWTTSPSKIAEGDDVLLSVRAPVGPTNLASARCAIGRGLAGVRGYEGIAQKYLLYALRASAQQLVEQATGTTFSAITSAVVRDHRIPIAPSAEQDRIVAAIEEQFSRLDAGVAALERVRQNLSRMRSAAFALIADSVDAWVTLGEIAKVVGGVTKDAKRQSDPSFVEVPYLRVANVQRGYLDLSAVTTIRVPTTTVEKLRLEPGDILFNEGGDRDKLGRGWIWEGKIKDCIHQNHVFRARLLADKFDPRFVSMHGNTFGRTWFEKMGKQTTNLASLNLTTLKSFPVPNLPVDRQREIVAEVERRLSLIDSLQSATDDSLARCNSLRSSILAAAFSGRLVPQNSTDEPASALLQRIAAERAPSNGRSSARTRKPRTPSEKVTA